MARAARGSDGGAAAARGSPGAPAARGSAGRPVGSVCTSGLAPPGAPGCAGAAAGAGAGAAPAAPSSASTLAGRPGCAGGVAAPGESARCLGSRVAVLDPVLGAPALSVETGGVVLPRGFCGAAARMRCSTSGSNVAARPQMSITLRTFSCCSGGTSRRLSEPTWSAAPCSASRAADACAACGLSPRRLSSCTCRATASNR